MRLGIATRPMMGLSVNGDSWFCKEWDEQTMLAIIDGLGHGEEANEASEKAKQFLMDNYTGDLDEIVRNLHVFLHDTRGAVLGLVRVNRSEKELDYCGVGNVDVYIKAEPPLHPTSLNGIVGINMRRALQFRYKYKVLGVILLHSDGISSRFDITEYPMIYRHPQDVSEQILAKWGNPIDDATVLIAVEEQETDAPQ
ncbi:MAG TPA: hypothetical protein VKM55_17790 [Candidatus Lokiarchaeia archaeon]|nr:hypothetical protein [Candidatus Lokiarchaeia archaeon]